MTSTLQRTFQASAIDAHNALVLPPTERPALKPHWRHDCVAVFEDSNLLPAELATALGLTTWATHSDAAHYIWGRLTEAGRFPSSGWAGR